MKVVNTYYGVQQTGAAKALFTSNSVDFVVVDIPYTLEEKTQMELQRRSQIAHYPLAATGVVFSWNRSAGQNNNTAVLPSSLNLSPEIIAKIYKGSITMWDDDLILELNPGVAFPVDFPITPVVLAGQAGSTFLLNKYLSISYPSYSPSGNSLYDLPLPNSIQAKTPQEVADALATLPGAFAYLPFSDMLSRHLPSARLCTAPNDLASCVAPSVSSFASAMDSASIVSSNTDKVWPSDLLLAQQPIQPSNPMPYPLTFFVYAIFTTDQSSAGASGAALGAYMQWVITNQPQQHAANYGFARLNQATIQINNATVYSDSVSAAMTYASGTSPSQYWPYVSPSSPQPQNPVPSNSPVTPPQQSYADRKSVV